MIRSINGLHSATACLVVAVATMCEQRRGPYVTYRTAARAISAGKRAAWDGGSWQRRAHALVYRMPHLTPAEARTLRADLVEYAETVRS